MEEWKVDDREFTAALQEYMRWCRKNLADILNRKALLIALAIFRAIPKASKTAIEQGLNVIGYKISVSKKTGQFKKRKALIGGPLIFKILNAQRTRNGEPGLNNKAMAKAAPREVARRQAAVGSLKAGMVKPIKALAAATQQAASIEQTPRVKQVGFVGIAKDGWDPISEFGYSMTSRRSDGTSYMDPRVSKAFQDAFNAETASMQEYITRKMQEKADTINAK